MMHRIYDLSLKKVSLSLFLIVGLVIAGGFVINGSTAIGGRKTIVEEGDKIKVHYTGSFTDGKVFDKSKEGKPLEFTVGGGQMIAGFDKAVIGMKLNEEKKINIKSEDAYGKRDEDLKMRFKRSNLPKDFKPEIGVMLKLTGSTGQKIQGTVIDIDEKGIIIDANHFLAGKDLVFDIKIVGIE